MSLEIPILNKKDFWQIQRELEGWIANFSNASNLTNSWTNRNPSDTGIAITELFSWLGSSLYYQIESVPLDTYKYFLRLISGVFNPDTIPNIINKPGFNDPNLKSLLEYQKIAEVKFSEQTFSNDDLLILKEHVELYMQSRYRAVTRHDYEFLAIEATSDDSIPKNQGKRVARAILVDTPISNSTLNLIKIFLVPDTTFTQEKSYILPQTQTEINYVEPANASGVSPIKEEHIYLTNYILKSSIVPFDKTALVTNVYNYLKPRRLIGVPLDVKLTDLTEIEVSAEVVFASLKETETSVWKVLDSLSEFLHPLTGDEDGKGWKVARSVTVYELSSLIETIPGVSHVISMKLKDVSSGSAPTPVDFLDLTGLPFLTKATILAKGISHG